MLQLQNAINEYKKARLARAQATSQAAIIVTQNDLDYWYNEVNENTKRTKAHPNLVKELINS